MTQWKPSPNLVAQLAHFAWGALFVFMGLRFGVLGWALLALFAWTLAKEFVFDLVVEGASVWDGFRDFTFYWLGAFSALLVLML